MNNFNIPKPVQKALNKQIDGMAKNWFDGELKIEGRDDLHILVTVEPREFGGFICRGYLFKDGEYKLIEGTGLKAEHAVADAKRVVRNLLGITGVIHG